MDNDDSPTARVERTFWTVWYYITGAVNRFFRPESADIASIDPNTVQEPAVDSEPTDSGHPEGGAGGRGGDEEQLLATASLLGSSRPLVAWELCTTDIYLGPDEEPTQHQPSGEGKASEEAEGAGEEQLAQEGSNDAGLLVEGNRDQKLSISGRDETLEAAVHEEHANTGALTPTGDAVSEDLEESGRNAGAEEETERAATPEEPQQTDETMRNIQVKEADDETQREDLHVEDIEVKLCPVTDLSLDEEDIVQIAELQSNEAAVTHEEVEDGDGEPQLETESDEGAKQAENQLPACEELSDDVRDFKEHPDFTSLHGELQSDESGVVSEDELIAVEQQRVTGERSESDVEDVKEESVLNEAAVTEEENVPIDEAPEQEDDIKTVTEDGEEDFLTEHVTRSEESVQDAETEPHTAEDGEREGAEVQTKTRETDDGETESHGAVSADERFSDEGQAEEEQLFREVNNKEGYMGIACSSVTVKPEGETGQEMSGEFKNIPPAMCEGRAVVSQELNFPTWEETREGVPEHNNEPDENTTQWFLEGDGEEIQRRRLPEEVESPENSVCGSGADYLLEKEHMEEEQESTRDVKTSFDAGLPQETEEPLAEAVIHESGSEEEEELLIDSMKTESKHSEKEFKTDVSSRDDNDEASKETKDGTEELLVEFNFSDSKAAAGDLAAEEDESFPEADVEKVTETSSSQESVDAVNSEQNSSTTPSLLEDVAESGFLKQSDEAEPEILADVGTEVQDAGIDMEDEMQNENEILHLQVAGITELTPSAESLSDEALEMSKVETATDGDESKTDESKPNSTLISTEEEEVATQAAESERSYAEETVRQDVIDEEILDLWIQAASSEDSGGVKQEEETEQDETPSPPTDKKSNSRGSELVSDAETSSSTVESGFLDLSDAHNSERTGVHDTLANTSESAEITEQTNSESQDTSMEEAAETERSYVKEEESIAETPEARRLDISDQSADEDRDESAETGSQEEIDSEEAESLTETSALFKVKKTTAEDEITATDSESGRSSGGSEEEEPGPTESERKFPLVDEPQPGWSEDIAESLHDDQMEVDSSALDFTAQRSRIAVKNPLVRPPKDPRALLHLPSVEPTPPPAKAPAAGVPLGGLGVGIKLPGLGAGFPVLKKTQRVVREEGSPDVSSQETKPEETSDEAQHKPKWTPPRHPGFGNPLMSELKTKLKKTQKE